VDAFDDDRFVLEGTYVHEVSWGEHHFHVRTFAPERRQTRAIFVFTHDPCAVAPDTHDARGVIIMCVKKMFAALDDLSQVVFRIRDPQQRAAVAAAIDGPGKPAGVRRCEARADELIVGVDVSTTPLALVRHLFEIECRRFARGATRQEAGSLDDSALARFVAEAIADPDLGSDRILEVRAPELDA
jgi:hypothetical protein